MAQLFKNIIPLSDLLQMPLRMVHALREVRIEQIERTNAEMENENKRMSNSTNNNKFSGNSGLDLAAMEEFIEEHS